MRAEGKKIVGLGMGLYVMRDMINAIRRKAFWPAGKGAAEVGMEKWDSLERCLVGRRPDMSRCIDDRKRLMVFWGMGSFLVLCTLPRLWLFSLCLLFFPFLFCGGIGG